MKQIMAHNVGFLAENWNVTQNINEDFPSNQYLDNFNDLVDAGVLTNDSLNMMLSRQKENPIEYYRKRPLSLRGKKRWLGTKYSGLGNVTLETLWKHWKSDTPKHNWEFNSEYNNMQGKPLTIYKCNVCGVTKEVQRGKTGKEYTVKR